MNYLIYFDTSIQPSYLLLIYFITNHTSIHSTILNHTYIHSYISFLSFYEDLIMLQYVFVDENNQYPVSKRIYLRRVSTYVNAMEEIEAENPDYKIQGIFYDRMCSEPCIYSSEISSDNTEVVYVKWLNFWFFICVINILIIYFRYLLQNVFLTPNTGKPKTIPTKASEDKESMSVCDKRKKMDSIVECGCVSVW
jgi:hypothetical protein